MTGHTIHVHASVAATPEEVWEVLTDVGNLANVLRSVSRSAPVTEGPYDVGTTWRETRSLFGHRGEEELHVIECRAPSHTTQITRLGHDLITLSWSLTPHNDGTTRLSLTATADMKGRSPVGKFAWTAFGGFSYEHSHRMLEHDVEDICREVGTRSARSAS